MTTPLISVLMPVYNTDEIYLREAIESVLNQTYTNFEFIICDDKSTNNALSVIQSYHDKRIRLIQNEKNSGISVTRNKLCKMAKGKYIALADSDDISLPTRFEKQIAFLESHADISLVGAWYERFPQKFIPQLPEKVSLVDMLKWCAVAQPVVMYRKTDFEDKNLIYDTNLSCAVDYDMWCRALMSGLKMANIPEVLLKYRWHEKNISHTKQDLQIETTKNIKKRIAQYLTQDKDLQDKLLQLNDSTPSKKIYLFGKIPFLKIKSKNELQKWYLFGCLPILKIKK